MAGGMPTPCAERATRAEAPLFGVSPSTCSGLKCEAEPLRGHGSTIRSLASGIRMAHNHDSAHGPGCSSPRAGSMLSQLDRPARAPVASGSTVAAPTAGAARRRACGCSLCLSNARVGNTPPKDEYEGTHHPAHSTGGRAGGTCPRGLSERPHGAATGYQWLGQRFYSSAS